MWARIEKDRRTFSLYWCLLPVLLLFLLIPHMAYLRDIILCKAFQVCQRKNNKENPDIERQRVLPLDPVTKKDVASRYMTSIEKKNLSSSNQKLKIVIYSVPRSGSSFLGEMLNRRKDVFYMYEPLHTLKTFSELRIFPRAEYPWRARRMLQNILNCRFHRYKDHLSFMSYPELSNPHFRLMSRVLSSPPFCREPIASNASQAEYVKKCFTLHPKLVSRHCSRKHHVVVKELVHRLPHRTIEGLSSLLQDPTLRMICLIRDPRAVVSSIKNIGGMNYDDNDSNTVTLSQNHTNTQNNTHDTTDTVTRAIEHVCSTLNEHYRTLFATDRLVRSKLVGVRYEDIVTLPTVTVRKLFRFLQFDADKDTIRWVVRNTHGHGRSSDNASATFSVHARNVTHSLNSWKKVLTFDEVVRIQERCGNVMEKFGYVLYRSHTELQEVQMSPFKEWNR